MKSFRRTFVLCGLALNAAHMLGTNCQAQNFTSDITVTEGIQPGIRLIQDASGGHAPRTMSIVCYDNGSNADAGLFFGDVTATTVPFWIQGSAPNYSMVISTQGYAGLGTYTPATNLHGHTTSGPYTFRMQDASGVPNTWDIEGGGLGFDVKDVTAGTNPFTILPGAPTNSLFITTVGRVGMGTFNPIQKLHVKGRVFADNSGSSRSTGIQFSNGDSGGVARYGIGMGPTNLEGFLEYSAGNGNTAAFGHRFLINGSVAMVVKGSGNVGLGVAVPTNPLQLASGAKCTAGGVWTSVSSRDAKQDIEPITSEQAREAVRKLEPVGYRYKNEPDEQYVGFIAEDVPDLVANKDRKSLSPMDITAVLTKVVQDQDRQLAEERQRNDQQQASLEQQRTTLEVQKQLIVRQQGLLDELTDRLTKLERQAGDDGHLAP